VVAKLKEARLN